MRVSALRFGSSALAATAVFLSWFSCAAQSVSPAFSTSRASMDQVVDRAIERERALMDMLKTRTPLIETYLQDLKFDAREGSIPVEDHYFFGRMDLRDTVDRRDYLPKGGFKRSLLGGFERLYKIQYEPLGFSWMIFADRNNFDRETYKFKYAHREFLGDVRCLVFEVTPKKDTTGTRFHGRVWIEDQQYNIVRLNGIYGPEHRNRYFFHMDSWRLNLVPGYWVPAYVYSEEGDPGEGSRSTIAFKAQTRLWGYDLPRAGGEGDHTDIEVDSADSSVSDQSPAAQDPSPLEAQHLWMRQAGENVIERLQNAGLLSPPGEVDKVLETVVNNLVVSNNLNSLPALHVRVMLTSPLESFSVGETIVVSRGLLDVLPDEASLAAVLAHELGHIVLGHTLDSKYAFSDRLLFSDESTYRNLGFRHLPVEETAADNQALEMLKRSPYKQNLATAGLFLRELQNLGTGVSALCTPHLGRGFMEKGRVTRMVALMDSAPALDPNKLDQVAALPMGARIKLNAWNDHIELLKTTHPGVVSAREKMPFELTPFFPHMSRYGTVANPTATASARSSN